MNDLTRFDRDGAERFAQDYEAVFYEGDYRRMASFYTEDAKLIASEMETIEGRPAIEEFWRAACERGRAASIKRSIHAEHVESAGELGYMRTTVVLQIGDAPGKIEVRGVTVWRREADGAWRMSVDISCGTPSAERPAVDLAYVGKA